MDSTDLATDLIIDSETGRSEIAECWISRGLSEKTRLKAALELNESAERQSSALEELRQLLNAYEKSHPDLVFSRRDDRFLRMFLRSRKYDVPQAMKLLKRYLKFHAKYPDLYRGVTLDYVRPALESKAIMALPERDLHGRRVIVFNTANANWSKISPEEFQKALVYVLDAMLEDEETQVNGFIMLEDFSGSTMTRLTSFDKQKLLQQSADLFQDSYPIECHGYHLFNQPWFFHIAYSTLKPYLTTETRKFVHIHDRNLDDLFSMVPKASLPAEAGGDGPPYDIASLLNFLDKLKLKRMLLSADTAD